MVIKMSICRQCGKEMSERAIGCYCSYQCMFLEIEKKKIGEE